MKWFLIVMAFNMAPIGVFESHQACMEAGQSYGVAFACDPGPFEGVIHRPRQIYNGEE